MKILIPSLYSSGNTYVKDIVDELQKYTEIVTEVQNFWTSNAVYDVVHIQWPEELFHWRTVNSTDITHLKERLSYFKMRGTKVVATLHNHIPHRSSTHDQELYDALYHSCDTIVNLGLYSTQLYPTIKNIIIPHPSYSKHFKDVKIHKKSNDIAFLSFGSIRSIEEELQIINGFISANIPNSRLIITNSIVKKNVSSNILQSFKHRLYLRYLSKKNISLIPRKLRNDEIEKYFNNADIIISPRISNLNSGVVYMGFTFGKIVVGPAIGNIKEVLEQNGNPTFVPKDIQSVAKSFIEASKKLEIGAFNQKYSKAFLEPSKIALQHYNLYNNLINGQ